MPIYQESPFAAMEYQDPSGHRAWLMYWDEKAYAIAYPSAADIKLNTNTGKFVH